MERDKMDAAKNAIDRPGVWGMVLAAGLGTRMRPLTNDIPKALAPLSGAPLIHRPLGWLRANGIRRVVINTHYLGHMIEEALGDGADLGLRVSYSREEEILGAGGGVGRARRIFGDSRLVLVNTDTIQDVDLAAMMERHERAGAAATMAVVPWRAGYTPVWVGQDGKVKDIGADFEEMEGRADVSARVFAGVSIIEPSLTAMLPGDREASLVTSGFNPAIETGMGVAAFRHDGYWRAVDDVEGLEAANRDAAEGLI